MIDNRTLFYRDNLEVLRIIPENYIDLIYLDPPFNKKKQLTYSSKETEKLSFKDYWNRKDIKDEWIEKIENNNSKLYKYLSNIDCVGHKSNKYYLIHIAIRLMECYRVLKNIGTIYFHCDSTMNSYLRHLMDIIFGYTNFRNEIIWYFNSGARGNTFGKRTNTIFKYTKSKDYTFNKDPMRIPYSKTITIPKSKAKYFHPLGKVMDNVWQIPIISQHEKTERIGYPTQKPLTLLERIIQASSNKGDIVLDPFCGSGTTLIAAERLDRKWIGIDISPKSYNLVKMRIDKETKNTAKIIYKTEL